MTFPWRACTHLSGVRVNVSTQQVSITSQYQSLTRVVYRVHAPPVITTNIHSLMPVTEMKWKKNAVFIVMDIRNLFT